MKYMAKDTRMYWDIDVKPIQNILNKHYLQKNYVLF